LHQMTGSDAWAQDKAEPSMVNDPNAISETEALRAATPAPNDDFVVVARDYAAAHARPIDAGNLVAGSA